MAWPNWRRRATRATVRSSAPWLRPTRYAACLILAFAITAGQDAHRPDRSSSQESTGADDKLTA